MKRFAQVDGGVVTGILQTTEAPVAPQGRTFVDITDQPNVREQDTFSNGSFAKPAPTTPKESVNDEILRKVTAIAAKVGV